MNEKSTEQRNSSAEKPVRRLPDSWIDRIFERLHGRFGQPFAAKWQSGRLTPDGVDEGILNAKKVWAEHLVWYSPDEIAQGLQATFDYPPSLDEFLKACRPALDYERAYIEAVGQMVLRRSGNDRWSNPVFFWAAVKLGSDVTNQSYSSIKGLWKAALDKAADEVKAGILPAEVPARFAASQAHDRKSIPIEEAKKRFAAMYAILDKKSARNQGAIV